MEAENGQKTEIRALNAEIERLDCILVDLALENPLDWRAIAKILYKKGALIWTRGVRLRYSEESPDSE